MSVRTQIERINGEVGEQAALLAQLDAAVDALPDAGEGGITPTGTIDIIKNGTFDVTNYAEANVNVPTPAPVIEPLTVTGNGTYTAPSGVDGYSPVIVNVPQSGGGGEDVNGNCTIIIKPAGSTNHYVYAEQISTDGTVTFFMSRAYTASDITVNARCGMTIPIMASNINGAECTAGEVVYVKAGYGIAYKVPNTPGETVQVTLAK